MEYKTLINLADSYNIDSNPHPVKPYIAGVQMNEVTSALRGMQIGGTAADTITFRLYNSPVTGLDGLRVELYTTEDLETTNEGIEFDISDDSEALDIITDPDVLQADERVEETEAEMLEEEADAFVDSFGYTSVLDINTDPDADVYVIEDDPEAVTGDAIENNSYRDEEFALESGIERVQTIPEEWTLMGVFFITNSVNYGDYIQITAMDQFVNMGGIFKPGADSTTLDLIFGDFVEQLDAIRIEVEDFEFDAVEVA